MKNWTQSSDKKDDEINEVFEKIDIEYKKMFRNCIKKVIYIPINN